VEKCEEGEGINEKATNENGDINGRIKLQKEDTHDESSPRTNEQLLASCTKVRLVIVCD
jgi:hypothetical protein